MRRIGAIWLVSLHLVGLAATGPLFAQGAPRPRIGLALEALSPEQLDSIEKSIGYRVGVRVGQVAPGSPAEKAGFRAGDVILAISKRGVASPQEAVQEFAGKAGRIEVTAARPDGTGALSSLTLFIDAPPVDGAATPPAPVRDQTAATPSAAIGLTLAALTQDERDKIEEVLDKQIEGVRVTAVAPQSPAAAGKLEKGDVILKVSKSAVNCPADVDAALAGKTGKVEFEVGHWEDLDVVSIVAADIVTETVMIPALPAPAPVAGGAPPIPPVTGPTPPAGLAAAAGLTLEALSDDDRETLQQMTGKAAGVMVTEVAPGSAAAQAGFRDDDVVLDIGGKPVPGISAFEAALAAGARLTVTVARAAEKGGFTTHPLTLAPAVATIGTGRAGGFTGGGQGTTGAAPTPDAAQVRAKLQALETAHAAGIRSDDEYARKRAELEAKLQPPAPAIDPATLQKLQALDAARQAGILSDAEYAQKRAALLGQQAGVAGPPPAVTPPAGFVLYRDRQGRFQLGHPRDWRAAEVPDGPPLRLSGPGLTADLMLAPNAPSAGKLLADVHGQIQRQCRDYRELGRGACTVGGRPAQAVEFTAVNPQGVRRLTQLVALVEGNMGYLFIVDAGEQEFTAVRGVWQTVLNGFALPGGGAGATGGTGGTWGGGGTGGTGGAGGTGGTGGAGGSQWPTL